jgi:MFS transporter, OFA family, oxalate/formate antiporter
VTFAGTGVNLALGVFYAWSVISQNIPSEWGWSEMEKSLPYSVAVLVFAFANVPGGRMQDRIGPRAVASLGAVLAATGLLLAGLTTSPLGYVLCFGVLGGAGMGLAYASTTAPAIKWFSKRKTGFISGIVVSGFGLAAVYIAPMAQWLSGALGLQAMMLVFGAGFLIIVAGLAQLLRTPPAGYIPPGDEAPVAEGPGQASAPRSQREYGPGEVLRTPQFYLLWTMLALASGAGLMVISKMAKIAADAGISLGFLLVVVLALGNGGGRILGGMLSDRIGRTRTMLLIFVFQAVLILLLTQVNPGSFLVGVWVLAIVAALIGANYGANLAVFPSVTKDWFGLRNFGVNYGMVLSSWGVGGLVLSTIAGAVYDSTGSFNLAYILAALVLLAAAGMTFIARAPKPAAAGPAMRMAHQRARV